MSAATEAIEGHAGSPVLTAADSAITVIKSSAEASVTVSIKDIRD